MNYRWPVLYNGDQLKNMAIIRSTKLRSPAEGSWAGYSETHYISSIKSLRLTLPPILIWYLQDSSVSSCPAGAHTTSEMSA